MIPFQDLILCKTEGTTRFKAIWFYTTFVCVFSIVYLFYRIATLFFEPLRFWLLYQVRTTYLLK